MQVAAAQQWGDFWTQALTGKAAVMLLFTSTADGPKQTVVPVVHGEVWHEALDDLDDVRARIRQTTDKAATERLTAMVMID